MTEFFKRTLDNLRQGPLGPVVHWMEAHPRLSAWIVLALGMDILLALEARDVGLLPHQWAALLIASTLVAGACVWIISWEDEPSEDEAPAQQGAGQPVVTQKASAAEPSAPAAEETPDIAPKKRTRKSSRDKA
jgi:hypothetical protein